ncbi:hypothetical protein [Embleya sp. NBC_00896]|uniref:hypothetical protein n=1 Tax=Embleya sp. NBC_00896 TaxID=2975961 RepID=UPI00386C4EF3|nr:hypothetical protein OG928_25840 [Embleya sp. NBC_00896]
MASDTGVDRPLDQVVYRWSYSSLLGRKGMGPVATSLTYEELRDWHGELDNHVSMDRSLPETPAWSMCRVRLEERYALILREAAIHGTNRPGNNAHILLDPARTVEWHRMLATAWLHGRRGGGLTGSEVPLADVADGAPMRAAPLRRDALDGHVYEEIRRTARDKAELLEVVLAAVLRDPTKAFTLHVDDVGADIVPLLWGVFELAQRIAPGTWTFSTYETSDASVKPRFVLVPRWPHTPEPANRLRIDPASEPQPGLDQFRNAAGVLVQLFCTLPWPEVDAKLVKVAAAARAMNASNRERAVLVLELDPDATGFVQAFVPPLPVDDPPRGYPARPEQGHGRGDGRGDGAWLGSGLEPGRGAGAESGESDEGEASGYSDTWSRRDESEESGESDEFGEVGEFDASDGFGESGRSSRSSRSGRSGRSGRSSRSGVFDERDGREDWGRRDERDERDVRDGRGESDRRDSVGWAPRRERDECYEPDDRAALGDRADRVDSGDRSEPFFRVGGGVSMGDADRPARPVPPRPEQLAPARPGVAAAGSRPALPSTGADGRPCAGRPTGPRGSGWRRPGPATKRWGRPRRRWPGPAGASRASSAPRSNRRTPPRSRWPCCWPSRRS